MSRIDERLEVMKVDTAEMTEEQKFSAATGLTFYDEELAKNEWYVPGGAANVSTKADSTKEETPVESPDENVTDPVVESTDETEPIDAAEPTETTESTEAPVTDPVVEPTDEPVTDPVTEPDVDPTPSEIEIETQP